MAPNHFNTFMIGPFYLSLGLFRGFIRTGRGEGSGFQWKTVWHYQYFSERNGYTAFTTIWPFKFRRLASLKRKAVR